MITIAELQQVYCDRYFKECTVSLTLKEKQNDAASLREVRLNFSGEALFISPDFLDDGSRIYKKQSTSRLNLRRICDGIILLKRPEGNYLLVIELKSGYSEVGNKAIEQIVAGYQKIRFHLSRFAHFDPAEVKELGLIFSFPPTRADEKDAENNVMVNNRKLVITGQADAHSSLEKEMRRHGEVTVTGKDFDIPSLHLASGLAMERLRIKHCAVTGAVTEVDLDGAIGE